MITEDYCSFETAKLLKEKRFDWESFASIKVFRGNKYEVNGEWIIPHENTIIPTLQTATKWLRVKHNLNVEVYRTACGYIGCIVAIPSGTDIKFLEDDGDDLPSGQYTTFEKACEATVQYCLKNLI